MKIKALALAVIVLLTLSSCNSEVTESENSAPAVAGTAGETDMQSSSVSDELREKYPEYFELSDFKGIEVYVWQTEDSSYRCGMMSGTNRDKTSEEITMLQSRSLSVDEAKAILDELGVNKEDIFIIPVSQPFSGFDYEASDEYIEQLRQMFGSP